MLAIKAPTVEVHRGFFFETRSVLFTSAHTPYNYSILT